MRLPLAIAGLLVLALAPAAFGKARRPPKAAAPAPAKEWIEHAKPKPPPTEVNLENQRPITLLSFEVVIPAKDKTLEKLVARLERPLAPGAKASLPLTEAEGCAFEARWKFSDVEDSGTVDLCNDAHIVLVD